jgi:hypothetical protein
MMHGEDGRPTIVINFDVLDRNTVEDFNSKVCTTCLLKYHISF